MGLRVALLLAGVLFLIALAAVESRRARRARELRQQQAVQSARFTEPLLFEPAPSEPTRGEPALASLDATASVLPVPPSFDVALQDGALPRRPAEPTLGELPEEPSELSAPMPLGAAVPAEPIPAEAASVAVCTATAPEAAPDTVPAVTPTDTPTPTPTPGAGTVSAAPNLTGAASPVSVEWPPEGQRQILSVRIVAAAGERLSGRAVRLALAACGFVHGRYRIFHQPAADGRALLSCASLSRPGNFDAAAMDFQRYAGLSLFTVLPGPLAGPAALERLLETAHDLALRLHAQLQDERGAPLDALCIAQLRASVREFESAEAPVDEEVAERSLAAAAAQAPSATLQAHVEPLA